MIKIKFLARNFCIRILFCIISVRSALLSKKEGSRRSKNIRIRIRNTDANANPDIVISRSD